MVGMTEQLEAKAAALIRQAAALPRADLRLLGLDELTVFLGLTKKTVSSWRARGRLPAPIAELRCGPVWDAATVELWQAQRQDGREQ